MFPFLRGKQEQDGHTLPALPQAEEEDWRPSLGRAP